MKVYLVVERCYNDEGEWVNTERVFSDMDCARACKESLESINNCERTSYEVHEWSVE